MTVLDVPAGRIALHEMRRPELSCVGASDEGQPTLEVRAQRGHDPVFRVRDRKEGKKLSVPAPHEQGEQQLFLGRVD